MNGDQALNSILLTTWICFLNNMRGPIRAFLERKGVLKPRVKRSPSPRWIGFGNWLGKRVRMLLRPAK